MLAAGALRGEEKPRAVKMGDVSFQERYYHEIQPVLETSILALNDEEFFKAYQRLKDLGYIPLVTNNLVIRLRNERDDMGESVSPFDAVLLREFLLFHRKMALMLRMRRNKENTLLFADYYRSISGLALPYVDGKPDVDNIDLDALRDLTDKMLAPRK